MKTFEIGTYAEAKNGIFAEFSHAVFITAINGDKVTGTVTIYGRTYTVTVHRVELMTADEILDEGMTFPRPVGAESYDLAYWDGELLLVGTAHLYTMPVDSPAAPTDPWPEMVWSPVQTISPVTWLPRIRGVAPCIFGS